MRKVLSWLLCISIAVASATSTYARGGTYNRAEPVFIPPDKHKTHRRAPVVVFSPEHVHYHLIYHPTNQ
jgi:hypothetical protein